MVEADGGLGATPSAVATPPWAVRIRRVGGEIAGSGILLSPDRVLTCAHVVDRGEKLVAEFLGAGDGRVVRVVAQVDGDAYRAQEFDDDGDPVGDVALLTLVRARPPETVTRLHRLSAPGRTVDMFGFPVHHNGGLWLPATVLGGCGRDGQVLLDPQKPGETARRGFSGGPVVDRDTRQVVGMVLAAVSERGGGGFTYMCPAETVVRHLPQVAAWTRGQSAVDEELRAPSSGGGDPLDAPFAERLALWMRGDAAVRGDGTGRQVKISLVRQHERAREATLLRAINLADRELRASTAQGSGGPPSTVPAAGGLDLALHAQGRSTEAIAERIARRMGRWEQSAQHSPQPAAQRVLAARETVTLVVVGVDTAEDPGSLLDLLEQMVAGGSRVLLVFRGAGEHYERAIEELLLRPAQQRRLRLGERFAAILAGPGRELGSLMGRVRGPHDLATAAEAAADTVIRVAAASTELAEGKGGFAAAPDQAPDPVRYEALADRADRRLPPVLEALRELLDERDRLTGLLGPYLSLYEHGAGRGEDLEADELYVTAHRLLRERPCDVPAARAAVRAFLGYVHEPPAPQAPSADPPAAVGPPPQAAEEPAAPSAPLPPAPPGPPRPAGPPPVPPARAEAAPPPRPAHPPAVPPPPPSPRVGDLRDRGDRPT